MNGFFKSVVVICLCIAIAIGTLVMVTGGELLAGVAFIAWYAHVQKKTNQRYEKIIDHRKKEKLEQKKQGPAKILFEVNGLGKNQPQCRFVNQKTGEVILEYRCGSRFCNESWSNDRRFVAVQEYEEVRRVKLFSVSVEKNLVRQLDLDQELVRQRPDPFDRYRWEQQSVRLKGWQDESTLRVEWHGTAVERGRRNEVKNTENFRHLLTLDITDDGQAIVVDARPVSGQPLPWN